MAGIIAHVDAAHGAAFAAAAALVVLAAGDAAGGVGARDLAVGAWGAALVVEAADAPPGGVALRGQAAAGGVAARCPPLIRHRHVELATAGEAEALGFVADGAGAAGRVAGAAGAAAAAGGGQKDEETEGGQGRSRHGAHRLTVSPTCRRCLALAGARVYKGT